MASVGTIQVFINQDYEQAGMALRILLSNIAPQVQPFDSLLGMVSQIDNYIAGFAKSPMENLVKAGWQFAYDHDTRFVSAKHPLGGQFSVVEMLRVARNGFEQETKATGEAISKLLNCGDRNEPASHN